MQTAPKLSLVGHFKALPDPRVTGRRAHDPVDALVIALCCLLCGGRSFNDIEDFVRAKGAWFRTFLRRCQGIHGTLRITRGRVPSDQARSRRLRDQPDEDLGAPGGVAAGVGRRGS